MSTERYTVVGMTCEHCVHAVTEEVSAVPGVHDVAVDLDSGRLTVVSSDEVPFAAIAAAVDEAGYAVTPAWSAPPPPPSSIVNVAAKLAGFCCVLAVVFGVAFLTGTQSAALLAPPEIHGRDFGVPSNSVEGYTLAAVEPELAPGIDQFVELRITGSDGGPLGELAEVDGRPMHLIAVRRDLTGFQHITPTQGVGTSWWAVLNLTPGPWHVIVELQPAALGRRISLVTDFTVNGDHQAEPLPAAVEQAVVEGLVVERSGALTTRTSARSVFTITEGGQPVTDLQPIHDALGHAVILRPDDLGYRHLHAVPTTGSGPKLEFEGGVPAPGTYRVFVEFYRGDRLHLAAFTVQVRR